MDLNKHNCNEKVCSVPFRFCEIHENGSVTPCCSAYCKGYSFGYVKFKGFEKVWNSKKASFFREKILNGDYSLCNKEVCMAYKEEEALYPDEIKRKYYDKKGNVESPYEIKMSCDVECNAACIICRDKFKKNSLKQKLILGLIMFNLRKVLKQIKILNCLGSGDPFGSSTCRKLLKKVSKDNPDLRFHICSNGVLMNRNMCEKLGIKGRINDVSLSIHASNKETYDKIVKFGNFGKVIENIKWLSDEKKDGNIKNIKLIFVINNINYKDIPEFIRMCEKYNATPEFSCYRYWETEYGKDFKQTAVWEKDHSEHMQFLEVLKDSAVIRNKHCFQDNIFELID